MHRILFMIFTLAATLTLASACSDGQPEIVETGAAPEKKDHVWKEQTDTLDRARGVQDTLDQASKDRRKQLEDDGR